MNPSEAIFQQAKELARRNRALDSSLQEFYWIPDNKEVRLIEIEPNAIPSGDFLDPFYFAPIPEMGMLAPSGVALIRPDEVRKLNLPDDWGSWDDAQKLVLD